MPFGRIAFLGSGETSLVGGRIFESLVRTLPKRPCIAVLETPAGFELNSAAVAGRVADFLRKRLQNYSPTVEVIPARKRGTPFSPDDPELVRPLLHAHLIFMGPGSPTYAVRQLRGSLAWDLIRVCHRLGACLVFASAATISVGAWVLPVYEIYKVGEDVHAVPGLDLFADFGLSLSFVPHWNNTEGGAELDTSRCFVGVERFEQWRVLLPLDHTVIGLDEHTGLTLDLEQGTCTVSGAGSVSIVRRLETRTYASGSAFPLSELGAIHFPALEEGLSAHAWELVQMARSQTAVEEPAPGPDDEVKALLEMRARARAVKDWIESDRLRAEIRARGWKVIDTPSGQVLERVKS